MDFTASSIPYTATGYFSDIICDYLKEAPAIRPYYQHPVSLDGLEAAIQARSAFATDRPTLVKALEEQYAAVSHSDKVDANIKLLLQENTFTITTAHQPAIFTGNLYFVYKILHAIRLASYLKEQWPDKEFVPVFWMGNEDADLEELGKIYLGGEKLVWNTKQTGAVGKMNTKGLDLLINRIEGELAVQPFGAELVQLLKDAYLKSPDIETATFKLVHKLFEKFGLVVVIASGASLKERMLSVFSDDLFHEKPSAIVQDTLSSLGKSYKIQAQPREINLFYLKDDRRDRIIKREDGQGFTAGEWQFTQQEMEAELKANPDRFSPNVILRGLFQASVLPDIAFIGGGGETAYWLELKDLFVHYAVPFPVLLLRNSFLLIERKWDELLLKTGFSARDLFASEQELMNRLVKKESGDRILLQSELQAAEAFYADLRAKAAAIDASLAQHTEALEVKAIKPLRELEKKMLRSEKRKFEATERQLKKLKEALFPLKSLQERIENFMPYYAKWGPAFIDQLYAHSLTLGQKMVILTEKQGQ